MENLGDDGFSPQGGGGGGDTKPSVAKGKSTQAKRKGRKAVKKKPDDMPRRPLSAYNFFFSEMRTTLLADRAAGKDSAFQKFLDERKEAGEEKKNGFFSNMGKFVAKRWKELTPDELAPYTEKAEQDLQRYRREMDEYREGVARKTRLASEQKLREQEAEAAKAPPMPPSNPGVAQVAMQPWMMGAGNPMMGFQGNMDPSFQLLLQRQLMHAQNPQFANALFMQQFGGMPGMQGFPGAMGQFDQQAAMGQLQQPQQGGQPVPGPVTQSSQVGQDMASQQGGGGGQQQYPDMQQNQHELLNSLQQNRMQGMYPGMMQGQFSMPGMGMAGMGMPGQDGASGMDQMQQQMQMGQHGNLQGQGGSNGQW